MQNWFKTKTHILLDLDGTLYESAEGIYNGILYAAKKMGLPHGKPTDYRDCIGPPLRESFRRHFGVDAAGAEEAILLYREYYKARGVLEGELYAGVPELLKELQDHGKTMVLATSKPRHFAEEVLEAYHIAPYFSAVFAAEFDGRLQEKQDVIGEAISVLNLNIASAVMVGDRKYDMEGAKHFGMDALGVSYGYGTKEELFAAGADGVVESVLQLKERLLGQ